MTTSHGAGHHSESSRIRTPQSHYLVPPQQGSRPHQTFDQQAFSTAFYTHHPRPMFVTGYGPQGPAYPRQFQGNYSPNLSSTHSISDAASQYSSSDRSGRGFMVPIPAQQESGQHLPRPQSAPSQMGDSSSQSTVHLNENGSPNAASNGPVTENLQRVAEPQRSAPNVFRLTWSSDTDVTSFDYQGPFSLEVIEGMITVKENQRKTRQENSSSTSTSQSTVNSSGQQTTPPPPNINNTSPLEQSGPTESNQ